MRQSRVEGPERAALVGLIAGRARRLDAERSLDELGGLAEAGLSPAGLSFVGRVYRHDTRIANRYLMEAARQKLACTVTMLAGTSDPSTRGYRKRFSDWGAFTEEVRLAELDGGHYFLRTHPAQAAEVIARTLREQG